MTDAELTKIYNDANGIPPGKAPPITTQRIFAAMRGAAARERAECALLCDGIFDTRLGNDCAEAIRAGPTP